MKLYKIKNGDYETKKVAAENMEETQNSIPSL